MSERLVCEETPGMTRRNFVKTLAVGAVGAATMDIAHASGAPATSGANSGTSESSPGRPPAKAKMKVIGLEEHWGGASTNPKVAVYAKDCDLGAKRIAAMDNLGVDIQVLLGSNTAGQHLPPEEAIPRVQEQNDTLAQAVEANKTRLIGFAQLPTTDPNAAAIELKRAVNTLGFKGVVINGRTGGKFLSDPLFDPILKTAAVLGVPIYLHPDPAPAAVVDAYYKDNLSSAISDKFATSAWGWHMETGTHAIHMIASGVFDRYPDLQVILGHWGEFTQVFVWRLDDKLPISLTGLKKTVSEYMHDNFYVTPSGVWDPASAKLCLETIGVDRIMYSADFPFVAAENGISFLNAMPVSDSDREKMAHGNAEKLLRL
jgi:predicted TIM-barrel fold metal-dependent hydrolase